MGAIERSKMRWESSKMCRLHPILINQAGEFYTAILWKIFDQPGIANISIDHLRPVQRMPLNNIRAMFQAPFEIKYALSPASTRQVAAEPPVMVPPPPPPSSPTPPSPAI